MLRLRRARLRLGVLRRLRDSDAQTAPDAGFTLIEVIVAITILTIISLFSAQLVQSSIRTSDSLNRYQAAVAVATLQMESVRGVDPAPDEYGTSTLFRGRPKSVELALFDTANNKAAASVAATLSTMYPEWDSSIPDGTIATSGAAIPPTGVGSTIEMAGATVIYRDGNGNRVYPTASADSFGSVIWNNGSGSPITATYKFDHQSGANYIYHQVFPVATPSVDYTTTVAPNRKYPSTNSTNNAIVLSTVNGYPSGDISLNGATYTTTIILGTCFVNTSQAVMNVTTVVNQPCGRIAAYPESTVVAAPVNDQVLPSWVANYTKLVRAIVVVQWTGSSDCTTANPCSYSLTSQFEPNTFELWWEP